ncbi:MAG: hypothetical protein H0W95_05220 [Nocardioidaceae bacterium]|nr:hypothetical protein [Nocardioidaceae bacterium]
MRGGDQAFTAFVDARSAALLRFAYLLAPEPTAAQDLLQTALLRTYLRWSRVRDSPDAYVCRVLVTVATDERRRPWRREVAMAEPPELTYAYDPTAGIDDVDELRRALRSLPSYAIRWVEDRGARASLGTRRPPYIELSRLTPVKGIDGSVYIFTLLGPRNCIGGVYDVTLRPGRDDVLVGETLVIC